MAELPKKSRAAVLKAPRERVEIREIEILPPEPGAMIVQVEAATVCGTDVHIWQGDLAPEWPVGMGHEMVGRIAALGIQPTVVVLGTGPVGLYALAMSIASGAGQTISIGAPAARVELAQKWGAARTINLEEVADPRERIEMVKK